jgi:hypothetical protein
MFLKYFKGWLLKMKKKWLLYFMMFLGFILLGCNQRGNDIHLITELPDTAEYAIDGNFVDIGIVYNTIEGEGGLSVFVYNKKWCLFNGNKYWIMEKDKLDEIAKSAGLTLPEKMNLPFSKEWGGTISFAVILIIVIFGGSIWKKTRKKNS